MESVKSTNIQTTSPVKDLSAGKIPVGIPGGDWMHITPQQLIDGVSDIVSSNLQDKVETSMQEKITNEIASFVQEKVLPVAIEHDSTELTVSIDDISVPTTYFCQELSSLTIEDFSANLAELIIVFLSGAQPTEIILPSEYYSLNNISIAANTQYVISVLNGIIAAKAVIQNHN